MISLTAQYGYTVALNIILVQISINSVMLLWVTKIVGSFLSVPVNTWLSNIQNKKTLLIILELVKAGMFLLLPLFFHHWILFVGVLLIEVIGDVFSGNLVALIPKFVDKNGLSRFNAAITSVGSVSYFLGPMLVGLFQGQQQAVLFYLYSGITFLGGLTLFALPPIKLNIPKSSSGFKRNVKSDVMESLRALSAVKALAGFYLIYILFDNMGTGLDPFEIIFVTKVVGLTSAQYAYSLSFLAVIFLIVSSALALINLRLPYHSAFQIGALIFVSYAIVLVVSRNLAMVLFSYVLLAAGSTIAGNMLDNMIQTQITDESRTQIFVIEDVLTNVLAAGTVFVLGFVQNIGFDITTAYVGLITLTMIIYLVIEFFVARNKGVTQLKGNGTSLQK